MYNLVETTEAESPTLTEDGPDTTTVEFEGLAPATQRFDVQPNWTQELYQATPAAQGGSLKSRKDLEEIGMDFSQS